MFTDYFQQLINSSVLAEKLRAYNLLAATRGPDAYDFEVLQDMKDILTKRVRTVVFDNNVFEKYLGSQPPFSEEEFQRLVGCIYTGDKRVYPEITNNRHYRQHLADAIIASHDHPIWNGYADKIADTLLLTDP